MNVKCRMKRKKSTGGKNRLRGGTDRTRATHGMILKARATAK
jgi:hypothetical protein